MVYGALFACIGVQLPYFPLWLAAKGLDPAAIGAALAIPMLVRLPATPFVTALADRAGRLDRTVQVVCTAAVAAFVLVGLADGTVAILAALAFAMVLWTPIMPILDAYALRGLAARRQAYGPVRLWGSAAFIAANLGMGFMLGLIADRHIVWVLLGCLVLTALSSIGLVAEARPAAAVPARHGAWRRILADRSAVAMLAAAALLQASHAALYGFATIQWSASGFDGATIALLWTLGVVAEIAVFALQPYFPPAVGPVVLIGIGAIGGVLRWGLQAADPPLALLLPLQLLHGATFGATHLGATQFVARHAPAGGAAGAQGLLSVAVAIAMGIAMAASGALWGVLGPATYWVMAGLAAGGGVAAVVAGRLARRDQPHNSADGG